MDIQYGRYEYINPDENSKKFWTVEAVDNRIRVSWGRIGTAGQSEFFEPGVVAKRVREKLKKGYVLVQNNEKPKAIKAPKTRQKEQEEFCLETALAKLG